MSKIKGDVYENVTVKARATKGKAHNLKLEFEDGSEEWVGYGFKPPHFPKGSVINVDIYTNDRGYLQANPDNVEIVSKPEVDGDEDDGGTTASPATKSASPGARNKSAASAPRQQSAKKAPSPQKGKTQSAGASRNDYWENKEKRDIELIQPQIIYQNSRTAAINAVQVILQLGLIELTVTSPKTGKPIKAKPHEMLEAFDALVSRYTHQYYIETSSINNTTTFDDVVVDEDIDLDDHEDYDDE